MATLSYTGVSRVIKNCSAPWENIAAEQEDIPEDVLMIILSKLPLKSLVRFQSVSKSWYKTIPQFDALFDHDSFLVIGFDRDAGYSVTGPTVAAAAKVTTSMKTKAPPVTIEKGYATLSLRFRCTKVIGACSGVICVTSSMFGAAVLWNPATGEEKLVMAPHPVISTNRWFIGFASVKDENNSIVDFKLLMEQVKPHRFLVYSLCSNSWRSINPPDFFNVDDVRYFRPDGVYLHGVLHWLVPTRDKDSYILTFDVATESFGKIMLPAKELNCFPELLTMVDDKYLAMFDNKITEGIYLWVMCRYGDMKSWAKHDNMWPWKMMNPRRPVGYLYHIGGLLMQKCQSDTIYLYFNSEIHKLDTELSGELKLVRYRESSVSIKRIAGEA